MRPDQRGYPAANDDGWVAGRTAVLAGSRLDRPLQGVGDAECEMGERNAAGNFFNPTGPALRPKHNTSVSQFSGHGGQSSIRKAISVTANAL